MRVLAFILIAALAQANANPFFGNVLSAAMDTVGSVATNPGMLLKPDELMTKVASIPKSLTEELPIGDAKTDAAAKAEGIGGKVKEIVDNAVKTTQENIKKVNEGVEKMVGEIKTNAEKTMESVTKQVGQLGDMPGKVVGQIKEIRETAETAVTNNVMKTMAAPIIKMIEDFIAQITAIGDQVRSAVTGFMPKSDAAAPATAAAPAAAVEAAVEKK